MLTICQGWFGNDHGRLVVDNDGADASHVSHGMCAECARIADALVRDYDRAAQNEPIPPANRTVFDPRGGITRD